MDKIEVLIKKSLEFFDKQNYRNKEAIMLAKVIVGITGFAAVVVCPPLVLVGIVGWASWTLYKNYTV